MKIMAGENMIGTSKMDEESESKRNYHDIAHFSYTPTSTKLLLRSIKIMKFNAFAVALFSSNACLFAPNTVQALKCGSAITKDCIGDTDVRYNADASNNLADQASIWKILPGLYIGDTYFYNSAGEPMKQSEFGFDLFPAKGFLNVTVAGSRYYSHNYFVAKHAFLAGVGACLKGDSWYTSTFDKDGSAQELGGRLYSDNSTVFKTTTADLKMIPVNDRTFYVSGESQDRFTQVSATCVDGKCGTILVSSESFTENENGQPNLLLFQRGFNMTRVDEKEFVSTMESFFDKYGVPLHNSTNELASLIKRPRDVSTAECATGVCPSEEDWQTIDPNFNESPYQEPDASLTAGFIAGTTTASFAIVAAIAYVYHRHVVKEREQRLKITFARAVAATIDNRATAQNLSPEDLKNEFDSIDTDNNGTVSKDEFRSFLADSSVANIDDKDFDVLFATIDLDGNSSLDFSEFCAFFAYIRGEFDTAIQSKSVRNMRKSTINLVTSEDE